MILICEMCGKSWERHSNKGMIPKRCPECKHKVALAAARTCNEKRRKLRARVLEKQERRLYPAGMRVCRKCNMLLPRELFYSEEGKRQGYCKTCRDNSPKKHGLSKCMVCGIRKPNNEYEVTKTGKSISRTCKSCQEESKIKRQQRAQEDAEGEEFIKSVMRERHPDGDYKQREARMDEIIREAEKRGISYGKYKAMLRQKEMLEKQRGV